MHPLVDPPRRRIAASRLLAAVVGLLAVAAPLAAQRAAEPPAAAESAAVPAPLAPLPAVLPEWGRPPEPPPEAPAEPPAESPAESPAEPPSESLPVATSEAPPASQTGERPADAAEPAAAPVGSREMLETMGIDESHFQMLIDGRPLGIDEQEVLLRILYRVRRFDLVDVARWTERDVPVQQLLDEPESHRGRFFAIRGRVEHIAVDRPLPEVVERFELKQYYLCQVRIDGGRQRAVIVTPTIPAAWQVEVPIDERFSAAGLFLKVGGHVGPNGEQTRAVFLAQRMAWHPDALVDGPPGQGVNFGMTVLGDLGMDVGQFEQVEDRNRFMRADREAFYQTLAAVGSAGTQQLVRHARSDLVRRSKLWQQEREKLGAEVIDLRARREQGEEVGEELQRKQRALAVVARSLEKAAAGQFSVIPLFNRPAEMRGELVVLDGTARRAVKISLRGDDGPGGNADIVTRFGFDHYWEIEIFTEDSQNNPLVFCVRDLPAGFPFGEDINEPVRLAGFFFKSWAYHTQQVPDSAATPRDARRRQQLAPLLIGREPLWIKPRTAGNPYLGMMAGGLFVLALLAILLWLWLSKRRDEAFRDRTIAARYRVEQGTSLDDLGIEAEGEPDFGFME